jgi:hypothetical protein
MPKERTAMEHAKADSHMEMGIHLYFQFNAAIERLVKEHRVLGARLLVLCTMAEMVEHKKDITNWTESIAELKQKVREFKHAFELHSNWEEEELFKLVGKYYDGIPGLIGLIEQEYELVDLFIDAFISVVDQNIDTENPLDTANMSHYLHQALSSLVGHFKKEEFILASLADFSNQYGY